MKKKYIYLITILIAFIGFSACSEDFLDKTNPNVNTEENFWNTEADALKAIPTLYSQIRGQMEGYYSAYSGGYQNLLTRGDDVWAVEDDEDSYMVTIFANTSENPRNDWGTLYKGINRANYYLAKVEEVDMNSDIRESYKAEAYFLRGMQYFLLVNNFEYAPLRTEYVSLTSQAMAPEVAPQVLWEQIEKDLIAAAEHLPVKRPNEQLGRVTKSAAVAYLGKSYLEQGKYQEAYEQFDRLINDSKSEGFSHSLMPKYKDNFTEEKEFNEESIFELNYYPHGTAGAWGSEGDNSIQGMVLPQFFGSPKSGGWFKVMPASYIIESYLEEERPAGSDTRFDKRMYSNFFFDYSDYEKNLTNQEIKDEIWYGDGSKDNPGYTFDELWKSTLTKRAAFSGFPAIDGVKGRFLPKKYTAYYSKISNGDSMYNPGAVGLNLRVMRFAEVLLLQAEVAIQLNKLDEAANLITQIRDRAGLVKKTWGGKDALWKEMQHQKLLEHWFEGLRFYDLKRWHSFDEMKQLFKEHNKQGEGEFFKAKTEIKEENGKPVEVLVLDKDGEPVIIPAGTLSNFQPKHLVYPIPQSEVRENTQIQQHPLWR